MLAPGKPGLQAPGDHVVPGVFFLVDKPRRRIPVSRPHGAKESKVETATPPALSGMAQAFVTGWKEFDRNYQRNPDDRKWSAGHAQHHMLRHLWRKLSVREQFQILEDMPEEAMGPTGIEEMLTVERRF